MLKLRVLDELWRGRDFRKPVIGDRPRFFETVGAVVGALQSVILCDGSVCVNHRYTVHSLPAAFLYRGPAEQEPTQIVKDADTWWFGVIDIAVPGRSKPATVLSGINRGFAWGQLRIIPIFEKEIDARNV